MAPRESARRRSLFNVSSFPTIRFPVCGLSADTCRPFRGSPRFPLKTVPLMPDTGPERAGFHWGTMRLIALTVALSLVVGLVAGGSLREFPGVHLRWWGLAIAGVILQMAFPRGALSIPSLIGSFVALLVFAAVNVRAPGFIAILIGLSLNALVIVVNGGMPVTAHAIAASGQSGTLGGLATNDDGQKHFLSNDHTKLLPLGDVIAIPPPVAQAVSAGDLCVHLGVGWFIVAGMRRRQRSTSAPTLGTATEA
jgi:Family of unknown function (DUF5317)